MAISRLLMHSHSRIVPYAVQQASKEEQQQSQEPGCDSAISWSSLPTHIIDSILECLRQPGSSERIPQAAFRASAVCKAWRVATHRLYFQENWQAGTVIQQPAQLVTLCPQQHSGSGHIKCYIRRTRLSSGLARRIYKFEMFQGLDYQTHGSTDKYLMAALQDGKQGYTMYLDRACSSKPIAQLLTNLMRTSYRLTAAEMSCSASGSLAKCSSSSSSSSNNSDSGQGPVTACECAARGLQTAALAVDAEAQHSQQQQQEAEPYSAAAPFFSVANLLQPLPRPAVSVSCSNSSSSGGFALNRKSDSNSGGSSVTNDAAGGQEGFLETSFSDLRRPLPSQLAGAAIAAAGAACSPSATPELMRVSYKLRVRGMMLPRRMCVAVPAPLPQQQQQQRHEQQEQSCPSWCSACSGPLNDICNPAIAAHAQQSPATGSSKYMHHSAGTSSNFPGPSMESAAAGNGAEIEAADVDIRQQRDQTCSSSCRQRQQQQQVVVATANDDVCATTSSGGVAVPVVKRFQQHVNRKPISRLFSREARGLMSVAGCSRSRNNSSSSSDGNGLKEGLPHQLGDSGQLVVAGGGGPDLHLLQNKPPHWNQALRCWCLNFRGRVRLASVKNFQLVTAAQPGGLTIIPGSPFKPAAAAAGGAAAAAADPLADDNDAAAAVEALPQQAGADPGPAAAAQQQQQLQVPGDEQLPSASAAASELSMASDDDGEAGSDGGSDGGSVVRATPHTGGVVMQFGKVDRNVFILDYDPVLVSALQAFAVALTTFGTKLLL